MIEIKNLTKRYGENTVYQNFNLDLEEGKITCILGESGSGKTTLLNCIARLTDFEGEISPVKCSYIFQSPRLVPNLTVYKNLALVNGNGEEIRKIAESVGLEGRLSSYPKTLSGGQAQRVSIARAFLFDGELILMDEPFSSLDLKLKREISELFTSVCRSKGKTAVFVTHDIDEALTLGERIIVIKGGKAVLDITPQSPSPRAVTAEEGLRGKIISALIN